MHDLDSYWSGGFRTVKGWVFDGLRPYLQHAGAYQEEQGITGNLAEIGVFEGRFFIALAHLARPDETCVAIDVFDEQDKNLDHAGAGSLAKLQRNLTEFAPRDVQLGFVQADSLAMLATEKAKITADYGSFRIISIDGCHTCEHTTNDLLTAQDWLATGGIIILDDYYNMHWPGVHEGVGKFYGLYVPRIKPFLYCHNKLFFTSFAYHQRYLDSFAAKFRTMRNFKIVTMYGSSVMVAD
jgi:hypothetical protein